MKKLLLAGVAVLLITTSDCRAQADPAMSQAPAADTNAQVALDFQLAQKMDTKEGWEAFLKAHPTGVTAVWAKKRLSEIEKGASGLKSEISNEGVRNIDVEIRYFGHKEDRSYDKGKITKTKIDNSDDSGTYSISFLEPGLLLITEKAGHEIAKYRCGLDKPIVTLLRLLEPVRTFPVECSYSHVGQSYTLTWSYVFNKPKTKNSSEGKMHGSLFLTILLTENGCKIVDSKNNYEAFVFGGNPYRSSTSFSSQFKSGSCVVNSQM